MAQQTINIPDDGMVCIPLNDPKNRFFLKSDGSQHYESDLIKTAMDRYNALYITEQNISLNDLMEQVTTKPEYTEVGHNMRLRTYRYILYHRNKKTYYNKTDEELGRHFEHAEYLDRKIMEAALTKTEFTMWKYFRAN